MAKIVSDKVTFESKGSFGSKSEYPLDKWLDGKCYHLSAKEDGFEDEGSSASWDMVKTRKCVKALLFKLEGAAERRGKYLQHSFQDAKGNTLPEDEVIIKARKATPEEQAAYDRKVARWKAEEEATKAVRKLVKGSAVPAKEIEERIKKAKEAARVKFDLEHPKSNGQRELTPAVQQPSTDASARAQHATSHPATTQHQPK